MSLTKEDLTKIIDKTPGLRIRFVGDPFVNRLTDNHPGKFLRANPHMRHWQIQKIITHLLDVLVNGVKDPEIIAAEDAYRKAADELYGSDGELEFDDGDKVSLSDDRGAYVQGWRWVYASDAKRCTERDCHGPAVEGGDPCEGKCAKCLEEETVKV